MKTLLISLLMTLCLSSSAQLKRFLVQGQVVDQNNNPISDVYIINLSNHEKDVSLSNGVFSFWISPTDSLVFSHISYLRKIVSVHTLLVNPKVQLSSENVDIQEVRITPEQQSDYDRANKNMGFLQSYEAPAFVKINDETTPVEIIMTENNDLMRVEAASLSLVRFSPSENIGKLFTKLKKKDPLNDYYSTRKQKEDIK